MTKQSNRQKYTNSYEYTNLLKTNSLEDEGLWQILGEDPNCEYGGCHTNPDLGFVEGKLTDVIDYAVELPNFWTWGSGGRIRKIDKVRRVDSNTTARRNELLEQRTNYEDMLRSVNAELEKL